MKRQHREKKLLQKRRKYVKHGYGKRTPSIKKKLPKILIFIKR